MLYIVCAEHELFASECVSCIILCLGRPDPTAARHVYTKQLLVPYATLADLYLPSYSLLEVVTASPALARHHV